MNIILREECEWPLQQGYWPGSDIYPNLMPASNAWTKCHSALLPAAPWPYSPGPRTHMGLVKSPVTFLQLLLSPPHTPHLSNFFFEPRFPSQPALMHLPWTQTEVESGVHNVPSTTCSTAKMGEKKERESAQMGSRPQNLEPVLTSCPRLAHLWCQHVEVASAIGSADELALVLRRHA